MFHTNRQTRTPGQSALTLISWAFNGISRGWISLSFVALSVICLSSCAANPSPDATAPRTGDSAYPSVLVDDDGERRNSALAAWASFTRELGIVNAPAPDLQPVTATLRSIPDLPQTPLYLPRVGDSAPMSEEETREALRRFIIYAGSLLCGEAQQLSLIQRIDGADGIKEAHYQQRPFRYPLRGGYGELRIGFLSNRRVTKLSSTCIPETERLRRGFVGLGQQRISAEKAAASLVGSTVSYKSADGLPQTYTISDKDQLRARELVTYPIARAGEPNVLEFHLAWEIIVEGSPGLTIYTDSIMGDVLGVVQGKPS